MENYKRKKQEQFSSFHDGANWTLAFGQFECCFVEKGEVLQTSVGPLEKLREKSGYCGILFLWTGFFKREYIY